jgi:hypothetical protein
MTRPSSGTGCRNYGSDLGKKRTGIFLRKGLDRCVGDLPAGRGERGLSFLPLPPAGAGKSPGLPRSISALRIQRLHHIRRARRP